MYILYIANSSPTPKAKTAQNVTSSSTAASTSLSSTAAAAPLMEIPDDDDQALVRSKSATTVLKVKVDDHFEVDKESCFARCVHCKRTYKVNKTTKSNLTQHIYDKRTTKMVLPVHDPQRRPGGDVPQFLQLHGFNNQYQLEAALFKFLLLTDQAFALIESENFRNMVKV